MKSCLIHSVDHWLIWEPAIEIRAQEIKGWRERIGDPESWTIPGPTFEKLTPDDRSGFHGSLGGGEESGKGREGNEGKRLEKYSLNKCLMTVRGLVAREVDCSRLRGRTPRSSAGQCKSELWAREGFQSLQTLTPSLDWSDRNAQIGKVTRRFVV